MHTVHMYTYILYVCIVFEKISAFFGTCTFVPSRYPKVLLPANYWQNYLLYNCMIIYLSFLPTTFSSVLFTYQFTQLYSATGLLCIYKLPHIFKHSLSVMVVHIHFETVIIIFKPRGATLGCMGQPVR